MNVRCGQCRVIYNEEHCSGDCPHRPLQPDDWSYMHPAQNRPTLLDRVIRFMEGRAR